jgi:AcrR family transcriptional regulator
MVKQLRAARTRQALVRAAAEAFAEDGYALASLPAISRRAGVSPGALHFHFPSKEALAHEVEEAAVARAEELADSCRATAQSSLQLLATTTCRLLLTALTDPVVRGGFQLSGDRAPKTGTELRRWWHSWVHDLIAQAHRDGELAEGVCPQAATAAVVAATLGLEELGVSDQTWLAPERLEEFWSFLLPRMAASPQSVPAAATLVDSG